VQEPLLVRHAELVEQRGLVLLLDPLSDDRQAEAVHEADQPADQAGAAGVGREAAHERLVELEPVQRQVGEVGQRRVAGAEVVGRDGHPGGAPALEQRRAVRAEDLRLRELQAQRSRCEGALGQLALEGREERGCREDLRADVDRGQHVPALVAPPGEVGEGDAEDGVGQWAHPPALLRQREEVGRGQPPTARVVPPHAGLDLQRPGRRRSRTRHDRLYTRCSPAVVQGPVEVDQLVQAHLRGAVAPGLVLRPPAPGALRPVLRDVGVPHERAGRALAAAGHADARAGAGDAVDARQRRGQAGADGLRDLQRQVGLLIDAQQDGELVTAEPRQRRPAAQPRVGHHGPQAVGDLDEGGVAGAVPVCVVEALEVVEVDDEQRQLLAVMRHQRVQALEQQPPVRQAGQRVGQRRPVSRQVGAVLLRQGAAGLAQQPVVVEGDRDGGADLGDEARVLLVERRGFVAGDAEHGDDAPAHPQRHEQQADLPEAGGVLLVGGLHHRQPGRELLRTQEHRCAGPPDARQHPLGVAVRGAWRLAHDVLPPLRVAVGCRPQLDVALVVAPPERGGVAHELAHPLHDVLLEQPRRRRLGERRAQLRDGRRALPLVRGQEPPGRDTPGMLARSKWLTASRRD
jgi:hypothetical protein